MKKLPKYLLPLPLSFLILFFLSSSAAQAEEKPGSAENLFEVEEEVKTEEWKGEVEKKLRETPLEPETYVVSGSKYAQSLREAPSAMTVLTAEDIKSYGVTSLEELLRLVPGVELKAINPANKLLGERGFFFLTANSVLVLIDGREENANIFGGVFWGLIPLSVGDIERVEVIRGPGSALYGANAYNGVINIVTRHPREEKTARIKGEAASYSGDRGFLKGNAALAKSINKLSLRISGGADRVMDWADPEEESYRAYRVLGRASYEFSGQTVLDLDGGWVRGDTEVYSWIGEIPLQGMDTGYANLRFQSGPFRFQSNYRRQSTRFGLVSPVLSNLSPVIKALLESLDIDLKFDFETLNQNSESRFEYTRFLGQKNRLTAGITYLFNRFDTDSIVDSPQWEQRGGFFLQDEYRPVEDLLIYVGARYDYNSATKDQEIAGSGITGDFSPRVSLVYLLQTNQSVRASFGRAFRKPSFFESQMHLKTFQNFEQLPEPYNAYSQFLYSPDVRNEHVNNYELGYFGQFFKRYTLTASIFFNQYLDTLNFCDDYRYHNIPYYANSYGGEANLDILLPGSWRGSVNYGFLGIHQIDVSAGKIADNFPHHHFNLGIRWRPSTGPAFALLGHWVSGYRDAILNPETSSITGGLVNYENKLGNNFLLNVKAGYRFWKNRVEIGASVFNLLHDETREYPGGVFADFENPGRTRNYGGEKPALTAIGFVEISY